MIRFASIVALCALTATACGGTKSSQPMPTLPGDGTDNTAEPRAGQAAADPWAGRTDLIQTPAPQPPVAVELPPVERFTLTNGLEVIVVASRDLPVVGMRLAIRTGWQAEARDLRGVAQFTGAMLTKGTKKRSAEQIAEQIDFVGGTLSAPVSFEASFVGCTVLSKDLDTCLQLVPDVLQNSAFPAKAMDEVRSQLIASVQQTRDDPGSLAGAHFQNVLWGQDHVRGWPMSKKTIEAIGRDDLVRWYQTWFKPNNAVLAIAGDVDPKVVRGQLERAFSGWRKGKLPGRASYEDPSLAGVRVRIVDNPELTQTQIRIGHLGIAHEAPDYFATRVMNYTLGGGAFSSRLMKVVRAEGGKTYGASSGFDTNKTRGAFVASTFTRNEEVVPTIELILGELAKMRAEGPTAAELADAKANLTGSYATGFATADDVAGSLLAARLHDFDADYVRTWALEVGKVTAADAAAAAKAHLDPDTAVIVLVGPAATLASAIERAGWKYEVVLYTAPIAGYERDALEAAATGDSSADATKTARALLDGALAAKGGKKRVAALTSMSIEGKASLESPQVPGGKADATVQRVWVQPNRLRLDLKLAINQAGQTLDVEVTTVIDDDKGWVRQAVPTIGQQQVNELSAPDLADARAQLWRDSELILLRHTEPGTKVALAEVEQVDGVTYTPVVVARADDESSVRLFINPETKLLDRMTYVDSGEQAVEVYSSYKTVQGLKVAFRRNSRGAQGKFDIDVTSVKINPSVSADTFDKP